MPTVLVIEDEILIRLHVSDTFRDSGFDVIEAADGPSAVEILQSNPRIDAVFTDVSLPGQLDGFAVARWVQTHRPLLPIVLTSGEVTETHSLAVVGDEPFFAKPCDYAEVAALIRQRLQDRGRRAGPPSAGEAT